MEVDVKTGSNVRANFSVSSQCPIRFQSLINRLLSYFKFDLVKVFYFRAAARAVMWARTFNSVVLLSKIILFVKISFDDGHTKAV